MSWRLRRMSGTTCPHWAAVAHRRRDSAARWAARLAAVALGECRGPCQHGALVRALSRKLRPHRRLTPALHAAVHVPWYVVSLQPAAAVCATAPVSAPQSTFAQLSAGPPAAAHCPALPHVYVAVSVEAVSALAS